MDEDNDFLMTNTHDALAQDVMIVAVDSKADILTRLSAMKFNKADVRKPLASAVNVAKAGNIIVMEEDDGYIANKATGERMKVRIERNTYVYGVQM